MKKFLLLLPLIFLAACNGGGDKFVGVWGNPENGRPVLEIRKNGSAFLIERPGVWDSKTKDITPVQLDGDHLVMTSMFGPRPITIDEKTGNLVGAAGVPLIKVK